MRIVDTPGLHSPKGEQPVDTGYAVQGDCNFFLINRSTAKIIAANQTLISRFPKMTQLEDIFDASDSATIRDHVLRNTKLPSRFCQLRNGAVQWVEFYTTADHVSVALSTMTIEADALSELHTNFARSIRRMETLHDDVMGSAQVDQQGYFENLATAFQTLTGFDHTLILKCNNNACRDVMAAASRDDLQHAAFSTTAQAVDIPAATLHHLLDGRARQIFDATAHHDAILSTWHGEPAFKIDQSNASFRFVTEQERDFLDDMGATAAFIVGIVVKNQLWGVIACFHAQGPLRLDINTATLCHVLSDMASIQIAQHIEKSRLALIKSASSLSDTLRAAAQKTVKRTTLQDALAPVEQDLLALTGSCGMIYRSAGRQLRVGHTPSPRIADVMHTAAITAMNARVHDWVSTDQIGAFSTLDDHFSEGFGGMATFRLDGPESTLEFFRESEVASGPLDGDTQARSQDWSEGDIQAGRALHRGIHDTAQALALRNTALLLARTKGRLRSALVRTDKQPLKDALTGLANSTALEAYVAAKLDGAEDKHEGWLCQLNINKLKHINLTFGRAAGDAVLMQVTAAIRRHLPCGGHAARIGGNAFSVCLPKSYDTIVVTAFCENLIRAMRVPVFHQGREVHATCTAGVTHFGAEDSAFDAVLSRSDIALYKAKTTKAGAYSIFTTDLADAAIARRKLETDIEDGLQSHAFIPYFQPQIDSATGRVVGLEVLARWMHPERGTLAPQAFLDVAKHMGAIEAIDVSLFQQSIATQLDWKQHLHKDLVISLNVSVDRLTDDKLISDLEALGPAARMLTIEVQKSVNFDHPVHDFDAVFKAIRRTGVGIEVGDFRSSRRSIRAVTAVRPDRLKIDRRLVAPVAHQHQAREVLKSVLQIGHNLGIKSVAEGVETAAQVEILRDLGCERLQGFHLGRPMPAREMSQRLALEAS